MPTFVVNLLLCIAPLHLRLPRNLLSFCVGLPDELLHYHIL